MVVYFIVLLIFFFFVCYCFVFVFCLFFGFVAVLLLFNCYMYPQYIGIISLYYNISYIANRNMNNEVKSTNTNSFNNSNQSSDKPQASRLPYVNDISPVDQTQINKQWQDRGSSTHVSIEKPTKSWTVQRHGQWMFVLILILTNQ